MKNPLNFLLHVPVPWVYVLAYLAGIGLEHHWPTHILRPNPVHSMIVGGVLFALGLVIAVWAQVLFRRARTTTVPGRSSTKLVASGPYRFTRNPMYVGLALAYLGEAGMLKQLWPVLTLLFIFIYLNWTVIPLEEAKLGEVFPSEYDHYRSQVRRWI